MTNHVLADYVRILARGKRASRHMTREESEFFMDHLLQGDYHPEQLGAVFMLLRVMEEEPQELAGFASAINKFWPEEAKSYDLIWSSYAGKRRQPMWWTLSAYLLTQMGYRILVHGTLAHTPGRLYAHEVFDFFHWDQAIDGQPWPNASKLLYVPCSAIHPKLQEWLSLKSILGVRSPINTVLKTIAPPGIPAVQGIFHPSYKSLHAEAGKLNESPLMVIKGEGGEFEVNPERKCDATRWVAGAKESDSIIIENQQSVYLDKPDQINVELLADLWNGQLESNYAESAVINTAALALMTIEPSYELSHAISLCQSAWDQRTTKF